MTTSLAQQLQRLAAPQTSNLQADRKKFPSILFDPKEAANKDRSTIFELGLSGLYDLIKLNEAFEAFLETLFDEGAKDIERSVENAEVNRKLDTVIRRFFHFLSPYFLLQPAHKCLEWLIRRFRIQDFNKDDFVMLLLPYHETQVAVKCIQTMFLKNPNDKWHWLLPVRKSGSPLAKQTIHNHGVGTPSFLEMIGDFTVGAIATLEKRANSLQAQINFFCLTSIAILDVKVSENHVKSILNAVGRGLKSSTADFQAAALMIASHLVTKRQVGQQLCDDFISRALQSPYSLRFRQETILLMTIICQTQESFRISPKILEETVTSKWFFKALADVCQSDVNFLPLLLAILKMLFREIHNQSKLSGPCQESFTTFLDSVDISGNEAKEVIRCVLEGYESGAGQKEEEDEEMQNGNSASHRITKWYVSILKTLADRHVVEFDEVVKEITASTGKKQSLKNVLGFLFKFSCSQSETDMFEGLFDANSERRLNAVEFVVKNFDNLQSTSGGQDLLKMSVSDRLSDDDPLIIEAALNLGAEKLVSLLGAGTLIGKLESILVRGVGAQKEMESCVLSSINLLLLDGVSEGQKTHVMLLLLPYRDILQNEPKTLKKIQKFVSKVEPGCDELLKEVKRFPPIEPYVKSNVSFLTQFLESASTTDGLSVLRTIKHVSQTLSAQEQVELQSEALKTFVSAAEMSEIKVQTAIFSEILAILTKSSNRQPVYDVMKLFLGKLFKKTSEKVEFISTFCVPGDFSSYISLLALKLISSIVRKEKTPVTDVTVIRMLFNLASEEKIIRQSAFEVVESLASVQTSFQGLIQKLQGYKEEILLDSNQLPLVLYTTLTSAKSGSLTTAKDLRPVLDSMIDFVLSESTSFHTKAMTIQLLSHISATELFERLVPVGLDILGAADGVFIADDQATILRLLLRLINKESARAANKKDALQRFILTSLETIQLMRTQGKKPVPVATVAVEMISPEVFGVFSETLRSRVVESVVTAATVTDNAAFHSAAQQTLKSIVVSHKIVDQLVGKILTVESPGVIQDKNRRRSTSAPSPQVTSVLENSEWKKAVTTLELLQSKLSVDKPFELVPNLFEIFGKLLKFDEHPAIEYVKQLVLGSILIGCQKQLQVKQKQPDFSKIIKVELVIQCIRGTQNPQTHHHALLLLAHIAALCPDQVLHEVVAIFTFMGSSVARYDDDYSFQIMTQIIENVIPKVVTKENASTQVIAVLRVFADIFLDVPNHRRLTVYKKLIDTMGAEDHLWMFLSIVLQNHVKRAEKDKAEGRSKRKESEEGASQRFETALAIANEFHIETLLETCTKLMDHISLIPTDEQEKAPKQPIFDADAFNAKETRFYRYASLQFVRSILTSPLKVADHEALQPYCSNLIADILRFIPSLVKISSGEQRQTYWKVVLNHYYDILDCAIGLLTPDLFLKTVHKLIQSHKLYNVRVKVIEMLSERLQHRSEYFEDSNALNMVALLEPFKEILSDLGEESPPTGASVSDWWNMQQLALTCIKLMARRHAKESRDEFVEVMSFLARKYESRPEIPEKVLGSLLLCLAELCANLDVSAITSLHLILPGTIAVVAKQSGKPADLLLISAITAISKISETLAKFVSPYLANLLITLSSTYTEMLLVESPDERTTTVLGKLKSLWVILASNVPSRVIIPAINNSYDDIIGKSSFAAVGPVMELTIECFSKISGPDFQALQPSLTEFFVKAMQFRAIHVSDSIAQKDINKVEEHVIRAFSALVLKLSESVFRPLYFKIHNWAFEEAENSKYRTITYFKLSHALADSLKSLFLLFAGDIVEPAAKLLVQVNDSKSVELCFDLEEENLLLLENILRTLDGIATYDNEKFLNEHRFSLLMEPIVDQVENSLFKGNTELKKVLQDTITSIGTAVADDTLWKQLNVYLLGKSRLDDTEIKIFALQTSVSLAQKLGDDYVQLLPETIPFFAELMESDVYEVEQAVQKALQDLEAAVGEDLQKYF